MAKILKKLVFLLILILSLSTFAFATVTGENENGYTLTIDLSLTLDDVESLINVFKNNISNLFNTTNNNLIEKYNIIDKYYFLRAYNTRLEEYENDILSKYLSSITTNTSITKQNIIVYLENANYSGASGYPVFNFFISNLSYPNGVETMKYLYLTYGNENYISVFADKNSSFFPKYSVQIINNNNEYIETITSTWSSNPLKIYLKTSNINLSVNSSSIIDIPTFATYKSGVIYYKTQNESTYYPYILKQTFGERRRKRRRNWRRKRRRKRRRKWRRKWRK